MNFRKTAVAAELPIALDFAKQSLRIGHAFDDQVLDSKLRAAVEFVEERTGRALRLTTGVLELDGWPACGEFTIRGEPIRSVLAVEYQNAAGAWVAVAAGDWAWRRVCDGAEVYFFSSFVEPDLGERRGAVRARFEAGYEAEAEDPELVLPARVRELVLMLAGHWYDNPGVATAGDLAEVPVGARSLLEQLRIW